ncbi:cysteine-rich CWC family protein [Larkinella arboricola]|uniref:cysteine-rich CWC family protein n=1 Tax=Larkinella arboricola TaxID=643671 RepID=UPI000DB94776|nr:cysteine-rich CWC family protein [Larkinella arboricola]
METQGRKHETVGCPRCGMAFECKVGSINQCQCVAVQLSEEQRNYIRSRFANCLCANCLREVRTEYNQLEHQKKMERFRNAH